MLANIWLVLVGFECRHGNGCLWSWRPGNLGLRLNENRYADQSKILECVIKDDSLEILPDGQGPKQGCSVKE